METAVYYKSKLPHIIGSSFSQDYKITTSVTDLEMYQNLGWRVCIPISSLNFPMFSEAVSKAGKSVCSPFQTPQKILKHST